jgi:RNA polymerase sigma factor for flagellar operon FliA
VTPQTTKPPARTAPDKAVRARARRAYADGSRREREEEWILGHLPLVRHIVRKVTANLARRVDEEDLVGAGTLGLVKAAQAYDPAKHTEFSTYAYIRIRGAVIDELRGRSFSSPGIQRLIRKVRDAYQGFLASHGRPPEDHELAEGAEMDLPKLYRTLEDARRQHFLSIHGLSEDDPALEALIPAAESSAPDAEAERLELLRRMADAIQELPERDRQVVLLYYDRDLTMKEAAEALGVTESRVSQVHASALFKLAMKLGGRPAGQPAESRERPQPDDGAAPAGPVGNSP